MNKKAIKSVILTLTLITLILLPVIDKKRQITMPDLEPQEYNIKGQTDTEDSQEHSDEKDTPKQDESEQTKDDTKKQSGESDAQKQGDTKQPKDDTKKQSDESDAQKQGETAQPKQNAEEQPGKDAEDQPKQNADVASVNLKRAEYMLEINKELSLDEALEYAELFDSFASTRDYLDAEILMAICQHESKFRKDVGTKYVGLMQVSAKYGQKSGYTLEQLYEPYSNIEYACSLLDAANKEFPGNLQYILLAYAKGLYALKSQIESGTELSTAFPDYCITHAEEIKKTY